MKNHKFVIYQLFVRLFGNQSAKNLFFGTKEENGTGKFSDINKKALQALKKLGSTHIWYTGVIEHASMTDYSAFGILPDNPHVVKGRAGSPYAIKDYYDVNPDFAEKVTDRMKEFESLIQRTHENDLKVIIDFVPNHVARSYFSDSKPKKIQNLGESDKMEALFDPQNNFYYLPSTFSPPSEHFIPADLDAKPYHEFPAKATGNDQFTATPSINDWFETVKLNYGVDVLNYKTYFDPIPDTWQKMLDILLFWAKKGVDGFRCDMAEMVPVEFWEWVIPKVKAEFSEVIFIAEIYNPNEYRNYIFKGKFDYLYDKVGLYDCLKRVLQGNSPADSISKEWQTTEGINDQMLRFLENHDEQRLASEFFAGKAEKGIPAMLVCATLNKNPVMIYFGQEVGEPALEASGFSGADGRTTIFDYYGVPEHQKWLNNGKFDGAKLSEEQKKLHENYAKILNLCQKNDAISNGNLFDLQYVNHYWKSLGYDERFLYAYLRYSDKQKLLIIVNFSEESKNFSLKIPTLAFELMNLDMNKKYKMKDILLGKQKFAFDPLQISVLDNPESGIKVSLQGLESLILEIK
ncbi:MAG: alpha-amylase [Bacteroidetes bacterium]|nr:MAG: alpha-amylase [Bacteroidota bacterium]